MKTKFLYIFIILVVGLVFFQSCQSDPEFPDPGFELTDTRVEVRRDTIDFYDIKVNMNVPNKVANIDLIDATDYSVLEQISDYNGKSEFQFNYRVDLRSFTKDTVLNYIIKVLDKDNRSINRGLRLSIKGFSYPEIKLTGGKNVTVAAPAYYVKGKVNTGLNNITSVKVVFEGKEQYSFTPKAGDTPIKQMDLKALVFLGNLTQGVDYFIDVVITDDKGQTSTTTIKVRKGGAVKKPRRINLTTISGNFITIDFKYDAVGNVTNFDYNFPTGIIFSYKLHYNSLNMLDTIKSRTIQKDGSYTSENYRYVNYVLGTKKVASVETQNYTYNSGNIEIGAKTVVYKNFVYNTTNGNIISFDNASGTRVNNVFYSDPFGLGEQVFGEYWENSTYIVIPARRQHRSEYDPVLMPLYTDAIPVTVFNTDVNMEIFNDLFWHKYIPIKTMQTDPTYTGTLLDQPSYSYEMDDEGNLFKLVKLINVGTDKGKFATYVFFYD